MAHINHAQRFAGDYKKNPDANRELMSSLIFAVVLWVIDPKHLCVSQEVQNVARGICCVSQPFCRLGGAMKISDVKRQGLAGLS
jgi:hypothetical protein